MIDGEEVEEEEEEVSSDSKKGKTNKNTACVYIHIYKDMQYRRWKKALRKEERGNRLHLKYII